MVGDVSSVHGSSPTSSPLAARQRYSGRPHAATVPSAGVFPPEGLLSQTAVELISRRSPVGGPAIGTSLWTTPHKGNRSSSTPSSASSSGATPLKKWSNKIKSFNRKLALAFETEEDECAAERGASPDLLDIGLSEPARRENFKKEQYVLKIERGAEAVGGSPQGGSHRHSSPSAADTATVEDVVPVHPEVFLENVKKVDQQIEDLTKSIRFEHLDMENKEEEKGRAEREEARRRREAEQRRARKHEQEARDPHRKIALMMENRRRFEGDEIDKAAGIPMQKLEIPGTNGKKQQVSLVDVRLLQSRCQMLEEGGNVHAMLEMQRKRERHERLMANGKRSLGMSSSAPSLSLSPKSCSPQPTTVNERLNRAKELKQISDVDRILAKLGGTRGDLPYALPFQFDFHASPVLAAAQKACSSNNSRHHELRQSLRIAAPQKGETAEFKRKQSQVAKQLAAKIKDQGSQQVCLSPRRGASNVEFQKLLGEREPQKMNAVAMARRVSARVSSRPRSENRDGEVASPTIDKGQKAARNWMILRVMVRFIWLHHMTTRKVHAMKTHSIEIVKLLMRQLGEWTRIKCAVHRMINAVTLLQRASRDFLAAKRKRTEMISKEWQQIEDKHLQAYFNRKMTKIVQEREQKAEQRGIPIYSSSIRKAKGKLKASTLETKQHQELLRQMHDAAEAGDLCDWRAYRIPSQHRRAVISKFYMTQLCKHVKNKENFINKVWSAVQSERELRQCLKDVGAHDWKTQDISNMSYEQVHLTPPTEFWQFREETAMELIGHCARALASANIEPFQDHPANKEILEDETNDEKKRNSKRVDSSGKPPANSTEEIPEGEEPAQLDLEQLFNRFTPRSYQENNTAITPESGGPEFGLRSLGVLEDVLQQQKE